MHHIKARCGDNRSARPCPDIGKLAEKQEAVKAGPDDDGVVKRRDKNRQPDFERPDHQYLAKCRQQRHRGKDKKQVRRFDWCPDERHCAGQKEGRGQRGIGDRGRGSVMMADIARDNLPYREQDGRNKGKISPG